MVSNPQHSAGTGNWAHIAFDEIDSTNLEALRRAAAGERGPLWITALVQTRGRGRSGRNWASADGSVAATLLFAPDCPIGRLPELALVAGVAAYDAIASVVPADRRAAVRLKWPNDVLIDGAKVSGILIESTTFGATTVVAIGTGINVLAVPRLDGRAVAALAEQGAGTSVDEMAAALARSLAEWLDAWASGRGFARIREAWLERAGPIGERMSVNSGEGPVSGTFAGLDSDGALLLDDDGAVTRRFTFGDVAVGPSQTLA